MKVQIQVMKVLEACWRNSSDTFIDELSDLNHSHLLENGGSQPCEPKHAYADGGRVKVNTGCHGHRVDNLFQNVGRGHSKSLGAHEKHHAIVEQVFWVLVENERHQVLPNFLSGHPILKKNLEPRENFYGNLKALTYHGCKRCGRGLIPSYLLVLGL